MKTADEIKRALEICSSRGDCAKCPYPEGECFSDLMEKDARGYILQLENHIGELTEKVVQLEAAQPKWISVAERLPEDDAEVLTHAVDCNGGSAFAITSYTHHMHGYNIEGWCSPWQHFHNYYIVTHWMPLPVPPRSDDHD